MIKKIKSESNLNFRTYPYLLFIASRDSSADASSFVVIIKEMVVLITNVITDYSLKIDIFNAPENVLIYSRADLTEFFQQLLDFLPLGIAAAVLVDFPFLGEAAGALYK